MSLYDQTWGRLFAAGYDWFLSGTEEAGLRDWRARLIADADGRVLEIGAGTGLNLGHYGPGVSDLTLAEPFGPMAKQLRDRVSESEREAAVVEAPAESLPFEDGEFDAAVSTLVLCTVDDQPASLAEIRRVLRPGGRLLFLEHVRSPSERTARWQDRLERPWKWFGHGCHPNRDTRAEIEAAGFEIAAIQDHELPKSPPIVRPVIMGTAVKPA